MTRNEVLQQTEKGIRQVISEAKTHLQNLGHEELNWKPAAGRWSIAECLEHLNRYSNYYNRQALGKLENADQVEEHGYKAGWIANWVHNSIHPENRKKMSTPKFLDPSNSIISDNIVTEFLQHQYQLLGVVEKAQQVDLNKIKVPVEVMKLIKLSLGDVLIFMDLHQQRHMIQAREVLHLMQTDQNLQIA